VGNVFGKVKAMRTDSGKLMIKALPSTPVRLLGLKDLPKVGDLLKASSEEEWKLAVRGFKKTEQRGLPSLLLQQTKEASIPKIPLVVKADVLGSIEALKEALEAVEKQGVLIVFHHKGLGVITEADVEQALATGSTILGFNVEASKDAESLAKEKNISIITSKIIYDLVDVVNKKADELLGPRVITKELGTAVIKVVFRQDKKSAVIGCAVVKGIIRTEGKVLVKRNGEQIGESKIIGLQSQKLPIQEAAEGSECGIKLKLSTPLQVNDELVYVIEEARQRK
jgi:translation initiation factor IF-2